jgi:two-component system chemotaxis response regulator CheB
MAQQDLRAFVIDDSAFYRLLLSQAFEEVEGVKVVGAAGSCDEAIAGIKSVKPDLVLCDVHMPGADGVQTVSRLKELRPDLMVVMMSGTSSRNADVTVRALQAGALDFIPKPSLDSDEKNMVRLRSELSAVVRLAAISRNAREAIRNASQVTARSRDLSPITSTVRMPTCGTYSAIVVGASTGGPEALGKFLPGFPADFPVPVLVAQHMPAQFTAPLANSLGRRCKLRVVEAQEGQAILPGTVYVAPGGYDMGLTRKIDQVCASIRPTDPMLNSHPNVNVLFRSAAEVYEPGCVLGVVMTGMGEDGLEGARALKARNCHCIVQSAATCVVFGMLRAVAEAGLADMVLPLESMSLDIAARVKLAAAIHR